MSALYLTRIELQEFRSFAKLIVDLPPGPCALIVHGSNGLGKSSLFDGLEWALTDKIDHFREAKSAPKAQYLRRWEAPPDRLTEIRLDFDDLWVSRTLAGGLDPAGVTDVTRLLQRADWEKRIDHLDRYLLLTHFLGQSTVSRMTHRDAKERWEFLQEPAQSDRATEIVKALHGHGSSTPARAFERRSQELANQAAEFERLLRQEQEQWEEAQLAGAIDDRAASNEASLVRKDLAAVLVELGQSAPDRPQGSSELVEALASMHLAAQDALRKHEERLTRARSLIVERQQAEVDLAGTEAALATLRSQAETLSPEVGRAEARVRAARDAVDRAVEGHRGAQAASSALALFQRARVDEARRRTELAGARALAAKLLEQVRAAEADARKAERRRGLADRLGDRVTEARVQSAHLSSRLNLLATAEASAAARDEAVALRDSLAAGNEAIEESVEGALANWQTAVAHVEAIEAELVETRRTVGELSAAVAAVAARIPTDACECPVCSTSFTSAEELRSRVDRAVDRLAPAVSALEQRLTNGVRERDLARARHAALNSTAVELQASRSRVDRVSAELADTLSAIGGADPVIEDELPLMRARLEAEFEQLAFRGRRADHWLDYSVVGGASGALTRWTHATQGRNQLAASHLAQQQTVDRVDAELRDAVRDLGEQASSIGIAADAPEGAIVAARAALLEREREAETELAAARAGLEAAEAEQVSVGTSVAQAAARIGELSDQAASISALIAQFEERWRSLSLSAGAISPDALQESLSRVPTLHAAIAAAGQRIQRLREGRIAWSRQQRHRATLEELRASLDAAPVADRESLRQSAAERQSALLRRSQAVIQAKGTAQEAGLEVTRRVEAFNKQFLAPLSKLMNRINRTILSEPEIGLDLKIGARKVEQRAIAAPGAPDFVSDLDPQLVHSEGQMAALAVSMLTAASLTFPWSRWPALIMDDPLQHNDVVHAAAFADMLRNLILARGYQVLLSTHDLGQAEFLRRKFQAADILCTTVHLLGRGAQGVESRVSRSGFAPGVSQVARSA